MVNKCCGALIFFVNCRELPASEKVYVITYDKPEATDNCALSDVLIYWFTPESMW